MVSDLSVSVPISGVCNMDQNLLFSLFITHDALDIVDPGSMQDACQISNPGFELRIHDRSCRPLGLLSTVSRRRFTDVDSNLSVFRFCNKLVFYRSGLSTPSPTSNLEDQGGRTSSGLYPSTCPAWVTLPGVQDSSRHSSRGH